MGVAANAERWQMHELRIAAMPVDSLDPEPRHGEPNTPVVLSPTLRRFGGNIVPVVDADGDAGKLSKIFQRSRLR